MNANLTAILQELCRSEINASISSFWDGGWEVSLGDEMNGYDATRRFKNDRLGEAAAWLREEAKRLYPQSKFAKEAA